MIHLTEGNILEADAEALVNTVNTVGVMGKGIALQFKKAFPEMFKAYEVICAKGELEPGTLHVYDRGVMFNPRFIINFPTKRDWRARSKLEDIQSGLDALVRVVDELGIRSIALPPLGCGQGGLNWADVFPLIDAAMARLPGVDVLVFPPHGAPHPAEMVNRTIRPGMTALRAGMIRILSEYCVLGYELTLVEIQKLFYLLQESGESLKLQFVKGEYGPYADNLRHWLHRVEGHFLEGFGEGKNDPKTPMRVLMEAATEAQKVSSQNADSGHEERVRKVFRLIEGFESPYGMELLASVHWVAKHPEEQVTDLPSAIQAVHRWNSRKKQSLQKEHIQVAWDRLTAQGWLDPV